MTPRRINSMLYFGAAAFGVASLAAIASIALPLRETIERANTIKPSTAPVKSRTQADQAMLASLEPIFSRPLRGKPAPAAPTVAARPATRPSPAPAFTLVGTIGGSTALLRAPDGNVVARSVGQRVGDTEVVAVRGGEVDLRIAGRVVTVRKSPATVTP